MIELQNILIEGLPLPMMISIENGYFRMAWSIDPYEYDEFDRLMFDEKADQKEFWTSFFKQFPELLEEEKTLIFPMSRLPVIRTKENLTEVL